MATIKLMTTINELSEREESVTKGLVEKMKIIISHFDDLTDQQSADCDRISTSAYSEWHRISDVVEDDYVAISYLGQEPISVCLLKKNLHKTKRFFVSCFGTHIEKQKKGYGSTFIDGLKSLSVQLEFDDITLDCEDYLIDFYTKRGFVKDEAKSYPDNHFLQWTCEKSKFVHSEEFILEINI